MAGKRAFKDYDLKSAMVYESARIFDASWVDLKTRIQKCMDELKEKNSSLKKSSEIVAEYMAKDLKPFDVLEVDESIASFLTRIKQDIPYVVKINGANNIVVSLPGYDKEKVLGLAKSFNIKGGGSGPIYRFSADNPNQFIEEIKKI